MKNIIITGGCGFIGSSLIRYLIHETDFNILNLDKMTYAGNKESLHSIENNHRYQFKKIDICDAPKIKEIFYDFKPDIIMHLAAESHVDRSIDGPKDFIKTNIIGTFNLLEQARNYWNNLEDNKKKNFRFHHISTDEVFGDLPHPDYIKNIKGDLPLFHEDSSYAPSSPYSASKASSDHLVRAWHRTYKLPVVITNCSNNYGPFQFPEKLIPIVILNALSGKKLPVYGKGNAIRDWLYVDDHVKALLLVATKGKIGETYNIGGHNEKKNIEVVKLICKILDDFVSDKPEGITRYSDLITHVKDRSGHDLRYAIDARKIKKDLGWEPLETFETGIKKTVEWYLDNLDWCNRVQNKK